MAPQRMSEELLAYIPGWLYAELSDQQIADRLGCSFDWTQIVIEQYVKRRGRHSRVQLVLEYVDGLAEKQPDHPDFLDAAKRVARLTEKEAQVLGALLQTCQQPAKPTLPAAKALTGIDIELINKYLARVRRPKALNNSGHWHVLVKLFYMNVKYQEYLLSQYLKRSKTT